MTVIKPTFYGTSAMTVYSYLLSKKESKNFKEPEILAILFKRVLPINKKNAKLAGWTTHYLIGLLFVIAYKRLWDTKVVKPTVKNGAILGAISGGIGVLGWKAMLKMHPIPPKLDLNKFYQQLIIAHIIFGIGATVGYNADK